jgi:hypothetical protein
MVILYLAPLTQAGEEGIGGGARGGQRGQQEEEKVDGKINKSDSIYLAATFEINLNPRLYYIGSASMRCVRHWNQFVCLLRA